MKTTAQHRLFLAGFIATFVMSILLYPAFAVRIPEFDFALAISNLLGGIGWWVGLAVQFLIGSFLVPLIYKGFYPYLPGQPIVKGIAFAVVLLVFALGVATPLMGFGVFATAHQSPGLIWLSLGIVHLTYGILLGGIAGRLR